MDKRTRPLVSTVIPAFNAERFIKRAIDSALAQTYENIEIIIINDGSTDATAEIVGEFTDPRIICQNQKNAGLGNARNNGIRRSNGEYITFLDSDDYYLPEKVEEQVAFLLSNKQYEVVYCNAPHFYSENPNVLFLPRGNRHSGNVLPELLKTSFINPNTLMAVREVFDKCSLFSEKRYYPEDWDMWLRIALAGFEFGYLDKNLVIVEERSDGLTMMENQPLYKKSAVQMFEDLFPGAIEVNGAIYSADSIINELKFKVAIAYLVNGQRKDFLKALNDWSHGNIVANVLGSLLLAFPPVVLEKLWILNRLRHCDRLTKN